MVDFAVLYELTRALNMANWLRLLPLMMKNGYGKNKSWLMVVVAVFSAYQLFSPTGKGAEWGIPSIDALYKEPRDILVDRVEYARDGQQETAEEFKTALEKFKLVTQFDGGDLEKQFNTLNSAFESSQDAADEITGRVDRVVKAANSLLDEWREELKQYHDPSIRAKAEQQFDQTRSQTEKLIAAMRKAEAKTKPVLAAFRDQVLFMKHNLNMQAISSLEQENIVIERDVAALIIEMEASIAQAELFIASMKS